jgi:di/tricarboxylate transporter
VVDVIRGDASLRRELASVTLEASDTVVVRARDIELMGFREGTSGGALVAGLEAARARRSMVIEALVGPNAKAVGRTLRAMRWRRRFGVYPLALHREGEAIADRLEDTRLAVGDTLLLDGAPENVARLARELRLILLSPIGARAFRRARAPVAVGALLAVVILAALDVAPILPLALIAAALVLVTGAVDAEEGFGAMDGRLLLHDADRGGCRHLARP